MTPIEQTCLEVFERKEPLKYMKDTGIDYWKTPYEFIKDGGGDCEDWCIYWRSLLIHEGIPEEDILMTWIPYNPKESHMVLLVRDKDIFWCMNILSYFVNAIALSEMVEMFGPEGIRWRTFTASCTNIEQWTDCLARIEKHEKILEEELKLGQLNDPDL